MKSIIEDSPTTVFYHNEKRRVKKGNIAKAAKLRNIDFQEAVVLWNIDSNAI